MHIRLKENNWFTPGMRMAQVRPTIQAREVMIRAWVVGLICVGIRRTDFWIRRFNLKCRGR